MSIRTLMNTAAGLALATGAGLTNALQAQNTAADFRADNAFVSQVAAANLMEVRLGQTAQTKAQTLRVQQYAAKMVNDHSYSQEQWMARARKHGAPFNARFSAEQEQQMTRLKGLSGREFEVAYMDLMVQDHQKTLSAHQTQGRSARSADTRELVEREILVLGEHSRLAAQIRAELDAPAVAANNPNAPAQQPGAQPTTPWGDVKPEVKPAPGSQQPTQTTQQAGQAGPVVVPAKATAKEQADIKADARFFGNAAQFNLIQQRLGELAQTRGQNAAVKRFGQMMAKDHAELQRVWVATAQRNGVPSSPSLGPKHMNKVNKIEKQNGKKFDKEYMSLMVQEHKEYLDYFQREGRGARSADVRAMANREIPILWDHFNLAKRVGDQVDAKTNVEPRATSSR